MITRRVWEEMFKVKGYILQIEEYNDYRRKLNRGVSYITLFCALVSVITAFIPECKWGTIMASVIVFICTLLKEWAPNIIQPEEELKELDGIHDFYKKYLQALEKLFMERYDSNSIVDDTVMASQFDRIKKSEKDNETRLNRLCRGLSKKEIEKNKKKVDDYFARTYQGIYK